LIGKRLALAARHVLRHFAKELSTPHSILASQGGPGESEVLWNVVGAQTFSELDIALLQLAPRGDEALPPPITLRLSPPEKGERVLAFGCRQSTFSGSEDAAKRESIVWRQSLILSEGEVREVFPLRRDRSFVRFPSFHISALCPPGTSGGPVLDAAGRVCGVICTGWDMMEAAEDVSYVSTLWPAMSIPIRDADGSLQPALEFAKRGKIRCEGWERVELLQPEDNSSKEEAT